MDLSQLSTEDLQALRTGDLSKVSTAGLQHLRGQAAAPTSQLAPQPEQSHGIGDAALGALEDVGTGIANIPGAILNSASDLGHRIFGGNDSAAPVVSPMQTGEAGKRLAHGFTNAPNLSVQELRAYQAPGDEKLTDDQLREKFNQMFANTSTADAVLPAEGTVTGDLARGALKVGGDVATVVPAGNMVKNLARNFVTEAGETAANGFRSGAGHPIARTVAGPSGKQALQLHNQQIGDTIAAGEANHPNGAPMSYETLDKATTAPNSVYTRVAAGLPEGAVDETAQGSIDSAGTGGNLVTSSDAAQKQIASMKTQLKQPMTGQQLVNNMRSLRQEGFKRAASADVDQQAIGQAQLDMANALEEHVARNLPSNGDVTLGDFQAARKTLAKNYAVQGALHGSNIDMQAIARIQRANPALLDGGLKDIADFANGPGRSVTTLPNTYDRPSLAGDVAEAVDLEHPVKGVARFLGGRRARDALTGDTAAAVQAAQARYGAQPGRFNPRPGLTPPPGTAGRTPSQLSLGELPEGPGPSPFSLEEGANPTPPNGGGRPGDIPLADLLSHGVEQSPPTGLSAGPMGSPPASGIPFRVNADHAAGGLQMAPEDSWFKGEIPGLGDDLAGVMSQGVPEGTAARIPQKRFVGDTVDFPGGTARRQVVENNASGESAASLEAQRRLARERSTGSAPFLIDPEGVPKALAHTVDAVDVSAPKGHVKVQLDPTTGKLSIMDRGGLSASAARGLLNRYKALHGSKLSDDLVPAT